MKILKRILIWVAISIALQFSILLYVNNYMLTERTNYKSKKVEKKDEAKPDANVKLPDGVDDINVSFDGKYVAYYEDEVLKVVNTKTAEVKKVQFEDGVQVSFYKWLPDRNRMLIAEKVTTNSGSGFKLSYYDIDKDIKEDIKNLTWADQRSEVEDIQVSTLTNVIYVKVAHSGKRSSIYWLNIMKEMRKVDTNAYLIGKIRSIPHSDNLVYEDLAYHKIGVTNSTKYSLYIKGVDNPCLLGIDGEDKIYIGKVENDKVTAIYSGKLSDDTSTWNMTSLKDSMDPEDIYIGQGGNVYLNDGLKGILTEMSTGKETIYQGKLIQMYDDGIASISNGNLIKTQIK